MKNYQEALALHEASLEMNLAFEDNWDIVAENYGFLGQDLYQLGKYEKALESFHQAFLNRVSGYRDSSMFSNPTIEEAANRQNVIGMLWFKGLILKDWYLENKDLSLAEHALQTLSLADTLTQVLRHSLSRHDDRVTLASVTNEVYKKAMATSFALYQDTGEQQYLERAFEFSEKAKSAVLHTSLMEKKARIFTDLPPGFLAHEADIKQEIDFYRSKIIRSQKKAGMSSAIDQWQNRLFVLNQSLDSLKQIMRNEHSDYYSMQFGNPTFSIADIQHRLTENQALIEYFEGDSAIYTFFITKKEAELFSTPRNPTLMASIAASQQLYTSLSYALEDMKQKSHDLYQSLLAQPLARSTAEINDLIIVPSPNLTRIPWELLLTNTQGTSFQDLSYLLKDYSCSYAYAASLIFGKSQEGTAVPGKKVLAFAPSYPENSIAQLDNLKPVFRDELSALKWNGPEVSAIVKTLDGEQLLGQEATEKEFKAQAPNYPILHLAMHALVDHEESMNSKLFFTQDKDSLEDNMLHTFEIFNLKLNASLAVLSGCNTGIGTVQEGEGVMSLARAFAYAGVPSLVMSQWNVNDESTASLMTAFYQYLAAGDDKDVALRKAKLDFLADASEIQAHPFYWGGFMVLGDTSPIDQRHDQRWWWLMLVPVLGVLIWWRYRKVPATAPG